MTDRVILLGTKGGPAIRPGSSMPTSQLVQMDGLNILVDAGLGVSQALCNAGVALTDLSAIVITHLHSDHYLELGPLLHTAWTSGLKAPVPVYGPPGLAGYWEGFLASMSFDITLRQRDEGRPPFAPMARSKVVHEAPFTIGSVRVDVMRNVHPPIEETFALRLTGATRSVVLSGDTAPMKDMETFARGADLLVHEAMLSAGIDWICARAANGDDRLRHHLERSHSPADQVGQIATAAGVGHLALNHLVPSDSPEFGVAEWVSETRKTWAGPLTIGSDGHVIALD